MEPIISPWFVYLFTIVDSLIPSMITIGIVLLAIGIGLLFSASIDGNKPNPMWKKLIGIGMSLIVITILTPSSDGLIKIYIANKLTQNNIDKTLKMGKGVKNEIKKDIIDILKSLNIQPTDTTE